MSKSKILDNGKEWDCTVDGIEKDFINVTMANEDGYNAVHQGEDRQGQVIHDDGQAYSRKYNVSLPDFYLKVSFKRVSK